MSVTNVRMTAQLRAAVNYVRWGTHGSALWRQHTSAGTHRIEAMHCDVADPGDTDVDAVEKFIARGEALAELHGRQVQAHTIVQSFEASEFNPADPADVQRVVDLGYALAKQLHPHSDTLVITHLDGVGGHPHNHIFILNHDNETGLALRSYRLHHQVRAANDQLMRDEGCRVAQTGLSADQRSYWEQRRGDASVSAFDQRLGDDIEDSLVDSRSVDVTSYRTVLAEKGIELHEKAFTIRTGAGATATERLSIGWTYKAVDETGDRPRVRRRKASSMSSEFTRDGATEIFNQHRQQLAAPALNTLATEHEATTNERLDDGSTRSSRDDAGVGAGLAGGERAAGHADSERRAAGRKPGAPRRPQRLTRDDGDHGLDR